MPTLPQNKCTRPSSYMYKSHHNTNKAIVIERTQNVVTMFSKKEQKFIKNSMQRVRNVQECYQGLRDDLITKMKELFRGILFWTIEDILLATERCLRTSLRLGNVKSFVKHVLVNVCGYIEDVKNFEPYIHALFLENT
ncbi:hypothetical protein AVEN_106217-1 [Araneus ventricosus]|uniref:Uncharacterized protein n=1 Tax=Araneus ventricosus TaxID=182803 RepID=A0A4Y2JRU1_ARAVE|nr:hypothetical protein AVEN_106217-1 [Araneus ventricosus]